MDENSWQIINYSISKCLRFSALTFSFLSTTETNTKWNSCACVITVMYKRDILCKFLININLISKKTKQNAPTQDKASQSLHLTKSEEHVYLCADLKSGKKKHKNKRKKKKKKSKSNSTSQSQCLYCAYPF